MPHVLKRTSGQHLWSGLRAAESIPYPSTSGNLLSQRNGELRIRRQEERGQIYFKGVDSSKNRSVPFRRFSFFGIQLIYDVFIDS
mgnify:CR=1 FL=1